MKPKALIIRLLSWLVLLSIIFFVGYQIYGFIDSTDDSARLALYKVILNNLNSYYLKNGKYPKDLMELKIAEFPDGGNKKTLKSFEYESDGKKFYLNCYIRSLDSDWRSKGENGVILSQNRKGEFLTYKFSGPKGPGRRLNRCA